MIRIALVLSLILPAETAFAQEDPAVPATAGEGKDALQRALE